MKTTADCKLEWLCSFRAGYVLIGALGLIHTWAGRHYMNPDGVSYLDIGDAYFRGDWALAINSYWSPLYSWLMGAALAIFQPSAFWEFAFVHLVNFAIFLGALACFEFFLRALTDWSEKAAGQSGRQTLPKWPLRVLGYSLFTWSSLDLITIQTVTPDMLVAGFAYLAAGLVLRSRCAPAKWTNVVALGVVLGVGYMAKTAMLPVALVFVAVVAMGENPARLKLLRGLVALMSLAVVAAPWVTVLSLTKGRLTVGDAGKLNYCWFVDSKADYLKNPPRRLLEDPPIIEFGTTVGGSNPRTYDPSYWWEGLRPSFNLRKQLNVIGRSALECYKLFVEQMGVLLVGAVIMWITIRRQTAALRLAIFGQAGVLIPALAAIVVYGLVQFETRYVGAYVVLIWMSLFGSLWVAGAAARRRLFEVVVLGMVMGMAMMIAVSAFRAVGRERRLAEHPQWQVANELRALGVCEGDEVGYIGEDDAGPWVRLARVRIVAEMKPQNERWMFDESLRSKVRQAFQDSGAKVIVAHKDCSRFPEGGWRRLGSADYFAFLVPQQRR
ncbi:MAG: hypothetical protein WCV00_00125 [Verrucomicrobiia bacterium]